MGPNVDYLPFESELNYDKGKDEIKLLFIGVEWERKGGQIAFETLLELKKKGFKAKLVVLGVIPPNDVKDEDLIVIPFLNKNIKEESDRFNSLLMDSHFLILPTREECFGVVFCEASAYGLPSLTTDTGGVGGAVVNGENGYRLKLTDRGNEYANKIAEIFNDYEKNYLPLAKSSRKRYENLLNWEKFSNSIKKIMDDFLSD